MSVNAANDVNDPRLQACMDFVLASAAPDERPHLNVQVLGISFVRKVLRCWLPWG